MRTKSGGLAEISEEPREADVGSALLESLVGYCLRRASSAMMTDFRAAVADIGLRPVLFAIIAIARENPGINQTTLGRSLGIRRANLVPMIAELVSRGLIERRPVESDRRACALHLTEEGIALLDEAEARVRPHEQNMLSRLSPVQRETLRELLKRIGP